MVNRQEVLTKPGNILKYIENILKRKKKTNKQRGSERTSKAGFGFDRNA